MDAIDLRILRLLQDDASLPVAEIARQVNLSQTPCWNRIQKLREAGVIRAQVTLCDAASLNVGVTVFVSIRTSQHNERWLRDFSRAVSGMEEIVGAYRMSGETDYLLKIVVPDIQAYDSVYRRLVKAIDLSDVSAAFVMEPIKETTALPLTFALT
ncbi:MAG: Lrp/AsnC family transcriptional regulator [Alphaproteobacteria bacterium]|nr:Lrp/AsnC family transcriptional regulator [Alphaproteobacteria bacterium]